jgi:Proto-chlorophyllide reductase 57 kD subunit
MSTKAVESIPWEPDALARLERIPAFVRGMAKSKIEKAALAAGEARVTVTFMDANKTQLMG